MSITDGYAREGVSKIARGEVISLLLLERRACCLRFCQGDSIQAASEVMGLKPRSIIKLLETANRRLSRKEDLFK